MARLDRDTWGGPGGAKAHLERRGGGAAAPSGLDDGQVAVVLDDELNVLRGSEGDARGVCVLSEREARGRVCFE